MSLTRPAEIAAHERVVEVSHLLADAARAAILPYFRTKALAAENKFTPGMQTEGRFDPVTAADRAAERAMREILARQCPDDGILGEEFGNREGTSGLTWVLDPIDGTRGFISGTPTWGVLIAAVTDAEGPIYGVIDQPYIGERFEGGLGRAQMTGPMGGRSLRSCGDRPLELARVMTTFPAIGTVDEAAAFSAVAERAQMVRYGCDCYAYALLACGQIDLVIEAGLKPYDVCAPIAVVEAAGGIVTDWRGGPAAAGGRIIAAAGAVQHAAALEILSRVD